MAKKKGEEGKAKNIGIEVVPPKESCEDVNCPFHGTLGVRGRVVEGEVVSAKAQKTVVIKKQYFHFIPKYERYERRHSRITAHSPECIGAKLGDRVKIAECRPLSKTKHFVIVEVLK